MPRGDKTGPLGQGSMTGRKFGNCNNHNGLSGNGNMNNTGFGYGRRMHNGNGMGRRFSSDHILYNEKNTNDLLNEILQLKVQLKSIEEKLKN